MQEMIQNAEDAGARTVKIVSVAEASKPPELPAREAGAAASWRPPFVQVLSVS